MTFQPGKSGNPGGRPKYDIAAVVKLRELTPVALEKLEAIAKDENHKDHFRAVESILNRVLGLPKQPIGLDPDDDASVAVAGSLAGLMALLDRAIGGRQAGSAVADGMASGPPSESGDTIR